MSKKIGKVQVTSTFSLWDEDIDLKDVFLKPEKVEIISAVTHNGGLYLVYIYEEEDFTEQKNFNKTTIT